MTIRRSFFIAVIDEINKAIDFATPINVQAEDLEKELRTYSNEFCLDDKKILTESTWKFLHEGGFLNHIPGIVSLESQEDSKSKKKAKKKKEKSIDNTPTQLAHVAENINKVLGIVPPIQVTSDKKLLFSHIKEAAMQIYKEDEESFDDDAWEYLQQNGLITHLNITQTKETDEEVKPEEAKSKEQSEPNTPKKKKKRKNKKPGKERLALIEELIGEGLHTNSQIAVIVEKEFDMYALSGTLALISNAKNPKYTKFKKLAKTDPITKILSFKDE